MILRWAKNIFIYALLLSLISVWAIPFDVYANQTSAQSDDVVQTEEELKNWCVINKDVGGKVLLGKNITLNNSIYIQGGSGKIIIDTNEYGLTFNGGAILGNNFSIVGQGVNTPIIDVYDTGGWNSHFTDVLHAINVKAVGDIDGNGGTAVRISATDSSPINLTNLEVQGSIISLGKNAIGIEMAVANDLYCMNVKTVGENSTAVYSTNPININYSKLNAEGENSTAVSGNKKTALYSCAVNPKVSDLTHINYKINDLIGPFLYYPVKQNSNDFNLFDYMYTFNLVSEDGTSSFEETFSINWEEDPYNIPNDTIGQTNIKCSLMPPFEGLGLLDDYSLEMIIDIRNPNLPCISNMEFFDRNDSRRVDLEFWHAYDPSDENVILWRSDDEGKTWYDFTDSTDLKWDENVLSFYYGEIKSTVILQLEVLGNQGDPGVGESNLAILRSYNGEVGGNIGGDRTGTDRVNKDDEPSIPNQTPDSGSKETESPASTDLEPVQSKSESKSGSKKSNNESTTKTDTKNSNNTSTSNHILNSQGFSININSINSKIAPSVLAESESIDTEKVSSNDTLITNPNQGKHNKQSNLVLPVMILAVICSLIFFGLFLLNRFKSTGKPNGQA